MMYQVIFAAPEQAILFPDGWAAVALQEPYRVDWHSLWFGASDTEYDVVNRRGTRTRTLQMPWNERIVGFGAGSVYVAAADADGVEHLRRHPWR